MSASGGEEVLLHPTVVWGTGRLLVFGMTSLPAYRSFRSGLQQDRWRAGAGVTYLLGG